MSRIIFGSAVALAAGAAALMASVAVARTDATPAPGKCPAEPAKALSIQFAVGYYRGSKLIGTTFCHDGATGKATVGGKTYAFRDGVCFRQGDSMEVQIGTEVNFKRTKSDPPGFHVTDVQASQYVKDGAWFGLAKAGKVVEWGFGDVKLKVTKAAAPKGMFSGVEPKIVNGKLTKIPASGSFVCRRVLKLPG